MSTVAELIEKLRAEATEVDRGSFTLSRSFPKGLSITVSDISDAGHDLRDGHLDNDVRRSLVHHVASKRVRDTEVGRTAIEIARKHPDEYIRDPLASDLGESPLIPRLPERD